MAIKAPAKGIKYIQYCPAPLGNMLMTSDGVSLTGLYFEGQRYYPAALPPLSPLPLPQKVRALFDDVRRYLDEYFSGKEPGIHIPIRLDALDASPFRIAIFKVLLAIPYGKTISYGQAAGIAQQMLHHRVSARATGQAVGHNPISIIIPCHRVVGADGSLTGYGGGLERKKALLAIEGIIPPKGAATPPVVSG